MMTGSLGGGKHENKNRRLIDNKRGNHCKRHQIEAVCSQRRKLQIITLNGASTARIVWSGAAKELMWPQVVTHDE